MKKIVLGFIVLLILLPGISSAQTNSPAMPKPPQSWIDFMQQENAKRSAFFKQLQADREAFLNANPDVKAYMEQMRAGLQARRAAWMAAHPRKVTP